VSRRLVALGIATLLVGGALLWLLLLPPQAPGKGIRHTAANVVRAGPDNLVEVKVTPLGLEPDEVHVHAGLPVTLVVTRTTEKTCATELVIPGVVEKVALPLYAPVRITFVPPHTGTLRYGCGMGMMVSGVLLVE
jgi:plastocyanin domain-containing protein